MGFQDDAAQIGISEETGPKRDQWGRPLLKPRLQYLKDQARADGRTWYSRASSLSDYGSGVKTGIETWRRRYTAQGIARRPDIAAMIAALPDLETDDPKNDKVTKAQVDEYIEQAMDATGSTGANRKSHWGTAVHGFTADGNPEYASKDMRADIDAYHAELARLGIAPVMDEIFVACDRLRTAGTFDHLYRLPDGRIVVGDKKTGDDHPMDAAIQMTSYANSDVYDWETDERVGLEDVANSFGEFDASVGLHVMIPRGQARCYIRPLNLDYAFGLGFHCAELRDAGHAAKKDLLLDPELDEPDGLFILRIYSCETQDELVEVMTGVTDEACKKAANNRWKQLTATS